MEIATAKSGEPTASVDSKRLHSAYNPAEEARKFLKKSWEEAPPSSGAVLLILGAGLGYLGREALRIRPDLRVLAFHLHDSSWSARLPQSTRSPQESWHPGDARDPAAFLMHHLKEIDMPGLSVLSWPSAEQAWPKTAAWVHRGLGETLRRLAGNVTTTAVFGRLWLKNILRNYLEIEKIIPPFSFKEPIVLAASGPSLEEILPGLISCRNRYRLWALPSSLAALAAHNLTPDLIVATDPGIWARLLGRYYPQEVPLAMPLTAAPPLQNSHPKLIFQQGSPGEEELGGEGPPLDLPARGTVAATAVELWSRLSSGELWLAGLDLCWRGIQGHVHPRGFEGWLSSLIGRQTPRENQNWQQARREVPERLPQGFRTGPALKIYAQWFQRALPPRRIHRLGSSPVPLPQVPRARPEDLASFPPLSPLALPPSSTPGKREQRREKILGLLGQWQETLKEINKHPERLFADPRKAKLLYALDAGGVLDLKRSPPGEESQKALSRLLETAGPRLTALGKPYE